MPESRGQKRIAKPQAIVGRRQLTLVVASILLGMLLSALDQTVVGTAMPRIAAELGGLDHYAWVFTGYMLASTVTLPIYGKLSDIYGRRLFFLGGMALFLCGSALSGLSQSMTQLILFRTVQGLGAGAILPVAQAVIGDVFPPAERGKWQGLVMALFGLASIAGPTLGGWLTDHWGWRWVFYVNMPVGGTALLTAGMALPRRYRHQQHRIDYLGAAALVAGAVPLLLAFSWAGDEFAWNSALIIGLLVWAAALLVAFVLVERRAAEPIISPALFRNGIFSVAIAASFLVSVGMFGVVMYLPLFVQGVLGASATGSGVVLTPMLLAFIVSSILGGQILSRTGRYKLLTLGGFIAAAAGMYLLSRTGATTPVGMLIADLVIGGLGIGAILSPLMVIVQNAVVPALLGQVTASLQFFRSLGSTIGIAVLGSVLNARFDAALQASLPLAVQQASSPGVLAAVQNPQAVFSPQTTEQLQQLFLALGPQGQSLYQQMIAAVRASLTTAMAGLFWVGFLATLLGLMITLFLREIPLSKRGPADAEPEMAERQAGQAAAGPAAGSRQEPVPEAGCSPG